VVWEGPRSNPGPYPDFCYATLIFIEHGRLYIAEIIVFCIPVIPERCFGGQKPNVYFVVVAVGTATRSREYVFGVCQMQRKKLLV